MKTRVKPRPTVGAKNHEHARKIISFGIRLETSYPSGTRLDTFRTTSS
jgi:hypothetical protein